MFEKYLSYSDIETFLKSEFAGRLEGTVTKRFAAQIILRKLYEMMRTPKQGEEESRWERDVRNRLDDLVRDFGLDKHQDFSDVINDLKHSFLANILNAKLLPEGFTLANDDVVSDMALYSFDDLRKAPPMTRRITVDLVSMERLFVMQIFIERGLGALVAQGRLEDYVWLKVVYEPLEEYLQSGRVNNTLHGIPDIVSLIRTVFLTVMSGELTKWKKNRDPQGRNVSFHTIITEEMLNDAMRYLLGLKDPTPEDAGWILPERTRAKIAPLRGNSSGYSLNSRATR
jgi:hypothetical protein